MHGIALKEIATFGEVNRRVRRNLPGARNRGIRSHGGCGPRRRPARSGHAVVSTYGDPARIARQRFPPDSDGPQGGEVGIQDGGISRCVPEGLGGGRWTVGSDRKRLCRRGQRRDIHAALLFRGAPASFGLAAAPRHLEAFGSNGRQPDPSAASSGRAEVRRRWSEESAGTRNMTRAVVKRMPQPIEAEKGTKNCA